MGRRVARNTQDPWRVTIPILVLYRSACKLMVLRPSWSVLHWSWVGFFQLWPRSDLQDMSYHCTHQNIYKKCNNFYHNLNTSCRIISPFCIIHRPPDVPLRWQVPICYHMSRRCWYWPRLTLVWISRICQVVTGSRVRRGRNCRDCHRRPLRCWLRCWFRRYHRWSWCSESAEK